jgi:hypothetical protein
MKFLQLISLRYAWSTDAYQNRGTLGVDPMGSVDVDGAFSDRFLLLEKNELRVLGVNIGCCVNQAFSGDMLDRNFLLGSKLIPVTHFRDCAATAPTHVISDVMRAQAYAWA